MDTDLTIKEAAEAMGVHPRTVRRYVKQGRVHWTMIRGQFGDEYRIARDSLGRVPKGGASTVQPLADNSGLKTLDIVNRLEEQTRVIQELRLEIGGLRERLERLLPPAEAEGATEQVEAPPGGESGRRPSLWMRLRQWLSEGGQSS